MMAICSKLAKVHRKPENNDTKHMLKSLITSSWKKKVLILAVILIAGYFIGTKIFTHPNNGYILGTAQKRTITEIISESGAVTTTGQVSIYSPTNGVIAKVFVTNGQTVAEGTKLFTVKSTATSGEKAAALAAYQAAKSVVQQAENNRRSTTATVDRVHDDLKNKDSTETFTEKESRVAAEVAHDNAYDTLLSARVQLVSAQIAYQATQNAIVTAPISGLVLNLAIASGSGVLANSPLTPTTPILVIGGLGPAEILISVGESDINKIQLGQKAEIKLDAVDNQTYQGVVRRFDANGSITGGVVKFNVYIEIVNPDHKIRPGMTADVDLTTQELKGVLSVPNAAVKPYQKGKAVRKLDASGSLVFIPVKIGVKGKEFTQISAGLVDGQEVVVSLTNEKAKKTNPLGI
jgi:HlyD family secretion protein